MVYSASALWTFFFLSFFSSLVDAQGPVQTLFPAAIPLAVKTPYMNMWYNTVNGSLPLSSAWPAVWSLGSLVAWVGLIRVNGTTYKWMGNDLTNTDIASNVTNIQITPTRSIFVMKAGPMNVTVTFLSPVEPDDWVKQSIPFSYVSVEAQSLDGKSYPVQMYSDISAEWESGDTTGSVVQWSNGTTAKSKYHKIWLQNPVANEEIVNQAQDGTTYYAISTSQPSITSQMDFLLVTRDQFEQSGILTNKGSTAFTTIRPTFPVYALAVDLGTIKATDSPITWSVGVVRDPTIQYTTASGAVQQRRPYYATQYSNIEDVIDAFTNDYAAALQRAIALDQKIMGDAARVQSSQYVDIVSLATRQTMSALDITVGTDSSENLVPDDIMVFMKNMGTDRRANPVEHIYMAFPAFMYLNASLGGALLAPLLASQPTSLSGQTYAAQDLGNLYPQAQSPGRIPQQGVEHSGNMLIMMLAHARISGDGTLLSQYYYTAKRWADYLVGSALESKDQQNQDSGGASALTNIALKGIIGVKAMAEIAHVVGEDADAKQYDDKAFDLLSSFLSRATSSDGSHLLGNYGDQQSWSLMYNIFADKLLGLNFVPQSAIDTHTQFLAGLSGSVEAGPMGLPIDRDSEYIGNAAWTLFTSAFVSDNAVRDTMIRSVYNHANFNLSSGVFSERYNVSTSATRNGFGSPALGGTFAHLALTLSNKTILVDAPPNATIPQNGSSRSSSSSNTGAIVGGVVGGVAVLAICVAVLFILRKRRRKRYEKSEAVGPAWHPLHGSHRRAGSTSDDALINPYLNTTTSTARIGTDGLRAYRAPSGADRPHASSTIMAVVGDARESPSTATQPLQPLSSKPPNASRGKTHRTPPSAAMPSSRQSVSVLDSAGTDPGSLSTTDVLGLRTEVENLRQVMHELRARQYEPPPEYVEQ